MIKLKLNKVIDSCHNSQASLSPKHIAILTWIDDTGALLPTTGNIMRYYTSSKKLNNIITFVYKWTTFLLSTQQMIQDASPSIKPKSSWADTHSNGDATQNGRRLPEAGGGDSF